MVNMFSPLTLNEALHILKSNSVKIHAGGTDIMVKPSDNVTYMFINKLAELREITEDESFLYVGAAVTMTEALSSNLIPEVWKKAIVQIASPAIRNMATIGGNICNASPAGDTLPFLYAADASVIIQHLEDDKAKSDEINIADFITGVKKTVLTGDRILTAVKIPKKIYAAATHADFHKIAARKSEAISKLTFMALAETGNGIVKDIRFSFGAVGVTVIRDKAAESKMKGISVKALKAEKAEYLKIYSDKISPIDDQRSTALYRKTVALNLMENFIDTL